jgi:hypothetical protein
VVGSPTHPVMPDLIVGRPAGRGVGGCQVVVAGGHPPGPGWDWPESKPGAAEDTPGPLRGKARRPAGGYFLAKKVSALGGFIQWACRAN